MPKKKVDFALVPLVQRKADELIALAASKGMPIRITEGYRSKERQDELYAQGRTKPGKIVTNAKGGQSIHQYGCAFDVVFVKTGYNGDWNALGTLGKSLGFTWGGDFLKLKDRPHFEMTLGYPLSAFQKNQIDWTKFA